MKTFKFKTSATEGSIKNMNDWDYTPDNVYEAMKPVNEKIREEQRELSKKVRAGEESKDSYGEKMRAISRKYYKIEVVDKKDRMDFTTTDGAQIETAEVILTIF